MILQGVSVDVIRKDCYDIPDKKLQGRVKFPIGGKPRKPKGRNRVKLRWRQYSLDERS